MRKILIFGWSDNPGGIEAYLLNMLESSEPNKYKFDILTVFENVVYKDYLDKERVKVYCIYPLKKNPIKHISQVINLVQNNKYDVVYLNLMDSGSAITAIAAKFAGAKVVLHSHNSGTERKILHRLMRPLLNLSSENRFACSKEAGKFMFGKNKFKIIPNMIDYKKYYFNSEDRKNVRSELSIQDKFVICHVGRIAKQKNPFGIINIFKMVYSEDRDARLLYVGDGVLKSDIEKYIEDLDKQSELSGIKNAIYLLGLRNDVEKILSASDVFIFPSLFEGLGISGLEAEVNGIPCIFSENIPRLIDIGGEITFISCSNLEKWKNKILEYKNIKRKKRTVSHIYDLRNKENYSQLWRAFD